MITIEQAREVVNSIGRRLPNGVEYDIIMAVIDGLIESCGIPDTNESRDAFVYFFSEFSKEFTASFQKQV